MSRVVKADTLVSYCTPIDPGAFHAHRGRIAVFVPSESNATVAPRVAVVRDMGTADQVVRSRSSNVDVTSFGLTPALAALDNDWILCALRVLDQRPANLDIGVGVDKGRSGDEGSPRR